MDIISFNVTINEAVKQFYRDHFCVEYLRNVEVTAEEEGDLYRFTLQMTLNQADRPITISGQYATEQEFQDFVLAELLAKGLPLGMSYFKLIQTDTDLSKAACPINQPGGSYSTGTSGSCSTSSSSYRPSAPPSGYNYPVIGSGSTPGPAGPAGPPGDSAYEVAVSNGFVGTETMWLASLEGSDGIGTDGQSAYSLAVELGFIGTEAEWIASLEGTPGYTPIKGIDYFDGGEGPMGPQGLPGYTPVKNVDYFDGQDGQQGPAGYTPIKGVDYNDGVNGTNGADGVTPIKGIDYFDGTDGTDGTDGVTPVKGVDYFDGTDGTDGVDGSSAFVYIAYASDAIGTNFTNTFNANLDYIAVLPSTVEILNPIVTDFVGLWKNYKGAPGYSPYQYTVFVSQTGTANPTVVTLHNEIGPVVVTRTAVGTYRFTLAGAFPTDKTTPIDDVMMDQLGNLFKLNWISTDVIELKTYAMADITVLADNVLNKRYININVFP